jgi:tetratricopeptide (TPR) repeat protein
MIGNNQAALAACNQAINLAPDSFEAWNNRGSAHQAMMSWDQALEDHKKALEINPNSESAHFNLGVVQQRTDVQPRRSPVSSGSAPESLACNAHLNLSHCLLSTLNLEEGWDHYEWRWLSSERHDRRKNQP